MTTPMPISRALSHKIANGGLLCAAFVVGIHVLQDTPSGTVLWWFNEIFHRGIFSIAVPYFFCCSGFLGAGHVHEDGWYCRECRKSVRGLLIPYVLWSAIFLLLNVLCSSGGFSLADVRTWVRAFGLPLNRYPAFGPLWYVRALLLFVAVSPLIVGAVRRAGWKAPAFCYVVWAGWWIFHGRFGWFDGLFHIGFSLCGLFWFSLGIWLRLSDGGDSHRAIREGKTSWGWFGVVCAVGIVALAADVLLRLGHPTCLVVRCLRLIYIPAILFCLWRSIPTCVWSSWLMGAAFCIYLAHRPIWLVCDSLLGTGTVSSLSDWAFRWVIGFGGGIALASLLCRTPPGFGRLLLGGRGARGGSAESGAATWEGRI